MPADTFKIKLQLLCEEALSPNCVGRGVAAGDGRGRKGAGLYRVFPQMPNAARFDEAIRDQAKYSKKLEGAGVPGQFWWEQDNIKNMESIITLRHFSPQAKQQTMLVRRLLDEYQAKKRNNNNPLSRIEEIEHLQMIYRASGAALRYRRQVGAFADGYLFPVLRAVHWTASDKMEQLLPNRIAASPKANSHLYFSQPAQLGGRDVGEIVMSHTGMTGHGHGTDETTDNVYLSEQEAWSWKISINNGKLYALNNYLRLDTTNANAHAADTETSGLPRLIVGGVDKCTNSYGYVMSTQGHLFSGEQTGGTQKNVTIGIKTRRLPVYHSSYLGGNDIRCGGRIFVQDGVLKGIDNASGHYQPTRDRLRDAILELKRQGVDLNQTYVLDWADSNFERLGIRKDLVAVNAIEAPWQTVEEFLNDKPNYGVSDEFAAGWKPHFKKVVDKYRKHSRGVFSRTSQETLRALAVLQGLEGDARAYFMASIFYAHYKNTDDQVNNLLKNYAGYVARNHFVRLTPLEQAKKRNGELKSGFRRKMIAVLPNVKQLLPKN